MPATVTHFDIILDRNQAIHLADEEDLCPFCSDKVKFTEPFITPRAEAQEKKYAK